MTITITPLQGTTFGAVVRGVDLRALDDDASWRRVEDAFHAHGILIFPGQGLTRDEHIAFAHRFGEIERQSDQTMRSDFIGKPIVLDISNVDADGNHITDRNHPQVRYLGGNEGWHSDSSFKPITSKASILNAVEAPLTGGQTGYADMRAAYDELTEEDKELLEGLSAYHSLEYSQAAAGAIDTPPAAVPSEMVGAWHPVVRIHPATGRKSLFIGRHACQIRELPLDEGRRLLDRLLDAACRPPRVYYHQWRPGDVVAWDNRCMLHRATEWDLSERRVLRHVRVAGDN
ncbi:TauD/TfdA dioxygenase family protein [Sphaerimonospora sp. CA-214678]|uniref:TauD/TfdA dioxygenase family protein n=1 Tax=Sphaerimonospora sp. CA-214678 TaxID=3240029 RepID=UPI003D89F565